MHIKVKILHWIHTKLENKSIAFLSDLVVSGVIGYALYLICLGLGLSLYPTLFIVAIGAHEGTRLLFLFLRNWARKYGVYYGN